MSATISKTTHHGDQNATGSESSVEALFYEALSTEFCFRFQVERHFTTIDAEANSDGSVPHFHNFTMLRRFPINGFFESQPRSLIARSSRTLPPGHAKHIDRLHWW
jgi:hypothetical protein